MTEDPRTKEGELPDLESETGLESATESATRSESELDAASESATKSEAVAPSPAPSRANGWARLVVSLLLIPLFVGCDQWTKVVATDHLMGEAPRVFWGGIFRLQYALNRGAFLGAGDSLSADTRFLLLNVGTGILLALIGLFLIRRWRMPALRFWALLLILAGGIGNLIDRIAQGAVVDFMVLAAGQLRTGIFNVADVLISTGVVLLAIEMIRDHRRPESTEPEVS